MALEAFKRALAQLLDHAPDDPLEREEFLEHHPLPGFGGRDFEVVVCDEERGIFAVIHTARLFEEGEEGQDALEALVPDYLQQAYGLDRQEWQATAPYDLGWRSREYLWFLEFTLPGLQPACRFEA